VEKTPEPTGSKKRHYCNLRACSKMEAKSYALKECKEKGDLLTSTILAEGGREQEIEEKSALTSKESPQSVGDEKRGKEKTYLAQGKDDRRRTVNKGFDWEGLRGYIFQMRANTPKLVLGGEYNRYSFEVGKKGGISGIVATSKGAIAKWQHSKRVKGGVSK